MRRKWLWAAVLTPVLALGLAGTAAAGGGESISPTERRGPLAYTETWGIPGNIQGIGYGALLGAAPASMAAAPGNSRTLTFGLPEDAGVCTGIVALYRNGHMIAVFIPEMSGAVASVTLPEAGYQAADRVVLYLCREGTYSPAAPPVVQAGGGTGAKAYILNPAKNGRYENGTYSWEFEAVINGEIVTRVLESKSADAIKSLREHQYEIVGLYYGDDGTTVTGVGAIGRSETDSGDMIYGHPFNEIRRAQGSGEHIYDVVLTGGASSADTAFDHVSRPSLYTGHTGDKVFTTTELGYLRLQGRTLYVLDGQRDYGISFTNGAKAVVIQPENGEMKTRSYSSVQQAIDSLGDADASTLDKREFRGIITAALNSQGVAEWVVFYSDTPSEPGTKAYILNPAKSEGYNTESGVYSWEFEAVINGEVVTRVLESKSADAVKRLRDHQYEVVGLHYGDDGDVVVDVQELDRTDTEGTEATDKIYGYPFDEIKFKPTGHQVKSGETVYDVVLTGGNSSADTAFDHVSRPSLYTGHTGDKVFTTTELGCLRLQGRTLYVLDGQRDYGIIFTNGARAVVIQPEGTAADWGMVTRAYNSVQEAIDSLAGPNTDTGGKEFRGIITASLNAQGVAEWVVFYSDTLPDAGSTPAGPAA